VLNQVEIDHLHFWEDISAGKGPMVSLDFVREFVLPYCKRIIDFVKSRGVDIIFVDTDGDCNSLIPLFLEVGVTGMYPLDRRDSEACRNRAQDRRLRAVRRPLHSTRGSVGRVQVLP
jgi:hypothetical protein